MVIKVLDEVVGTHSVDCRGNKDFDEHVPVFDVRKAVSVIVIIHKSGKTTPICQYRTGGLCTAGGDAKGSCVLAKYGPEYIEPTLTR
jgi:hypothetical protein